MDFEPFLLKPIFHFEIEMTGILQFAQHYKRSKVQLGSI